MTEVNTSLLSRVRGPLLAALLIVLGFFAGIGAWSSNAPLTSAAVAPGTVGLGTRQKIVQHLEGGIIKDIHVKEGDRVSAGDLLIELDDTVARSTLDLLKGQYIDLLATRARLEAERSGLDHIEIPEALQQFLDEPRARKALEAARDLFKSRQDAYASRLDILESRIRKLEEQIRGFDAQSAALERQLVLIGKEQKSVQELVDQGLERAPRLYRLQRGAAEIEGALGEIAARQSEAGVLIGETQLERLDLDARKLNQITGELADLQSRIADMQPRIRAAQNTLGRTEIVAPVDGTVVTLIYNTPGGVIRPGVPIMNIVPNDMEQMIEARVDPSEIDVVRPGLPAEVRFTAYSARTTPTVPGKVVHVSADLLTDETTGTAYYAIHVQLDPSFGDDNKTSIDPEKLYPGMPVEVMVVTGHQTLLDYFIQPVTDVLARAFRES